MSNEILGQGNFGIVVKGQNKKSGESVAIKICRHTMNINILKHETTVLNYLYINGCRNIPVVYWYGVHMECPTLVIPLYDYPLLYVFSSVGNRDKNREKADIIMRCLIEALESIHELFIIHRDIKPDNVMFKDGKVFIIDFGMATSYTDIIQTDDNELMGSPKYVSLNVHNGITPNRRDDMISLGYMYLFMMGSWSSNISKDEKRFENIIIKCGENNKIHSYLDVFYKIGFNDSPDYKRWKELF